MLRSYGRRKSTRLPHPPASLCNADEPPAPAPARRFGPIEGVQLGELLGRGAFGGFGRAALGPPCGRRASLLPTRACLPRPALDLHRCDHTHHPPYPCPPACLGCAGKVYKGRWRGAVVAVKVVDHAVQPGKTQDLSREPLLRWASRLPVFCWLAGCGCGMRACCGLHRWLARVRPPTHLGQCAATLPCPAPPPPRLAA